jgi:hypothetical protein
MVTPGQIPEITEADYQPEGDTELFDALSFQIDQIEAALNATGDREQAIIQLYLLSDGVDTGSNIVRFADLRARIEALQSTGKWHFHFNLTDLDTIELNALLGLRRELAETTSGPALRAALLDFLTPNDSAIQPTGSTSPSADVTSKNH